ncbi:histidine phosphatase family protein [Candidatus Falkowbacteria bacterium]|nr:histidine phosphatase family protein [Candidatus Falkowbacteria bacterium]
MKTGPYDPQISGKTKYASVAALTRQEYDPPLDEAKVSACLDKPGIDRLHDVAAVFCSDLLRTKQTADFLVRQKIVNNKASVTASSLLREIRFDVATVCSEEDYAQRGSDAVRQGFIDGFISDSLLESRNEIKARCDQLLAHMRQETNDTLFISHTFFLKIFLIYLEQPSLFEQPSIISEFIDPRKRIMKFCEQIFLP